MSASFADRKRDLAAVFQGRATAAIELRKTTSNLFRARHRTNVRTIDLRPFRTVLDVDTRANLVNVEGLTTYAALTDATLRHGRMPAVVPQLKSITIGGALSGGGIESSSFRHGFVHETIEEMEILLGDGSTVVATRTNEHRDLFLGFPNSYGTLGYALRVKARLLPVKRYVKLEHHAFGDRREYMAALATFCRGDADFIDGTVFAPGEMYVTVGTFTEDAPFTSDYTYMRIYYQSIRAKRTDYLTAYDYLWRWDADWFWCSRVFGMQRPLMRFLLGKFCLRSTFYSKLMALNHRYRIAARLGLEKPSESVIQDVQIPIDRCAEFLDFFHREIGIQPVWVCPSSSPDGQTVYPLYATNPRTLYVNFGFWDAIPSTLPEGHYNRLIERKVDELGGKKSLYSSSYYPAEEFARLYNQPAYDALKKKYDPTGAFRTLYEKCVQRA